MLIKRQNRSDSGFTLIEVLIVIAIIGVIAAIAAPSISNWRKGSDLNANTRRLYGFFQKARMEAVKRNATCSIVLTPTTYESKVGAEVIYSGSYDNGVTGTAITRSYNSRGLLVGGAATIIVQSPDGIRSRNLVFNTRGRMRIE